eukprot:CAMPEP_0178951816 /NCGR_PEP_ID=MMETSP0789-20121207/7444_1 /TAXON_ID=3005 /ORGANISM="Rhizosolenia setigera, Strain CCMP 1694" /LENGTH=120 /DNA_ID=CAMNT_0020632747 /DNA_START=233 /DNA_END=592 /DNA_ORIENTATION=-
MVKAGKKSPTVGEIVASAILYAITTSYYVSLADGIAFFLYVSIFIILPIIIIVDSYDRGYYLTKFSNEHIVLIICSNFSIFFFTFGLVDTMMKTEHFGIIGDSATHLYEGIRYLVELPIQ